MNQTEKRRKKLLEEMRNLYSDKGSIPAIHPRYKMTYQHLYPNDDNMKKDTFSIRCGICIIVFVLYVMIWTKDSSNLMINNMQVCEIIVQNYLSELY